MAASGPCSPLGHPAAALNSPSSCPCTLRSSSRRWSRGWCRRRWAPRRRLRCTRDGGSGASPSGRSWGCFWRRQGPGQRSTPWCLRCKRSPSPSCPAGCLGSGPGWFSRSETGGRWHWGWSARPVSFCGPWGQQAWGSWQQASSQWLLPWQKGAMLLLQLPLWSRVFRVVVLTFRLDPPWNEPASERQMSTRRKRGNSWKQESVCQSQVSCMKLVTFWLSNESPPPLLNSQSLSPALCPNPAQPSRKCHPVLWK